MRVLFITTSSNRLASGHPTGQWAEEFAVPYMAALEAGVAVTVASPHAGAVPIDDKSAPSEKEAQEWAPALEALRHSVSLASVREEDFDGIFIPGGHGPMVDLAHDATAHALIARHDAAGKPVAAVCHGPAALVNARRADGAPFLQGRKATGFTNTEESLAGLKDKVPFLLEDAMKAAGADFHSAPLPMLSHVEHDGNLITGQNPRSSEAIGQAFVKALRSSGTTGGRKARD
jgi:putative intracellular protease/amidase